MFNKKKELMNNAIAYVVPKNKTMAHIMSLNNRILFVVGIYIFGFKKYRKRVFNLIDINMIPYFKYLLQSETYNTDKKSILSTIQCKNNERLSQAGNEKQQYIKI